MFKIGQKEIYRYTSPNHLFFIQQLQPISTYKKEISFTFLALSAISKQNSK